MRPTAFIPHYKFCMSSNLLTFNKGEKRWQIYQDSTSTLVQKSITMHSHVHTDSGEQIVIAI